MNKEGNPKTSKEATKTSREANKTSREAQKTSREANKTSREANKTSREAQIPGQTPGQKRVKATSASDVEKSTNKKNYRRIS